jgi:acyl-CoA synthetase (AMP-forming)/AMP-acid ligase II
VRGYNVMQGYFDDPRRDEEAITPDGWLQTGDIGVMNERGLSAITDRIKDMFIVGGFNCYPAEIENLLFQLDGVAAGRRDRRARRAHGRGRQGVRRASECGSSLTEQEVIDWCRRNMANYKVPRSVEFVAALPVNAAGKVQKTVLRGQPG